MIRGLQIARLSLVLVVGICSVCAAQEAASTNSAANDASLKEPLKGFEPFVGTWVIDGQWADGSKLWAKNEYFIGMNGNFFEAKTYAKNQHGKVYQRYHTIWRHNKETESVQSYGFTYDGTVTITNSEVDTSDPEHPVIRSKWTQSEGTHIKQEVTYTDADSYSWKVWSSPDEKEWKQIMDGVWNRQK